MSETESCCRLSVDLDLIEHSKALLKKNEEQISEKARLFSLLGNEIRLKIISLLIEYGRMCVCDLSDVLQMNQSPISQHLRKLKDGGLLVSKREGMTIFYSIPPSKQEGLKKIVKG